MKLQPRGGAKNHTSAGDRSFAELLNGTLLRYLSYLKS